MSGVGLDWGDKKRKNILILLNAIRTFDQRKTFRWKSYWNFNSLKTLPLMTESAEYCLEYCYWIGLLLCYYLGLWWHYLIAFWTDCFVSVITVKKTISENMAQVPWFIIWYQKYKSYHYVLIIALKSKSFLLTLHIS